MHVFETHTGGGGGGGCPYTINCNVTTGQLTCNEALYKLICHFLRASLIFNLHQLQPIHNSRVHRTPFKPRHTLKMSHILIRAVLCQHSLSHSLMGERGISAMLVSSCNNRVILMNMNKNNCYDHYYSVCVDSSLFFQYNSTYMYILANHSALLSRNFVHCPAVPRRSAIVPQFALLLGAEVRRLTFILG